VTLGPRLRELGAGRHVVGGHNPPRTGSEADAWPLRAVRDRASTKMKDSQLLGQPVMAFSYTVYLERLDETYEALFSEYLRANDKHLREEQWLDVFMDWFL